MTASAYGFSMRPIARAIALATATAPALAVAQSPEETQEATGALEELQLDGQEKDSVGIGRKSRSSRHQRFDRL